MKYFNNENWQFELAGMIPAEFRDIITQTIDLNLARIAANVAWSNSNKEDNI
jgi:hypothetical protein